MNKNFHTICIGGGINSLVCATLLAKARKKVLVLESTSELGGCIRSEERENCIIDPLSTAYPLFITSPAYGALKNDLEEEGVKFVMNTTPTGSVLSNKKYAILKTSREENITSFNALHKGDGDSFSSQMDWVGEHSKLLFTFLGEELYKRKVALYLLKYLWKNGIKKTIQNIASFIPSVRNDLPNHFQSEELKAIMAPWILHTGLSPESPFSSTMSKIITMTIEGVGLPLVKGGSSKIVEAFQRIIQKNGGICITNKLVNEIVLDTKNKASGVKCTDESFFKSKFVVANVTPNQLYQKLIKRKDIVLPKIKRQVKNYKYGKGNMQIHLILKEKPKWFNTELDNVVYVHLTDGIDSVSQAVNEATRQYLPEKATICIAQPTAVDPSRANDGKYVLWIQLPECPNFPIGDATGVLSPLTRGKWTESLKEAYGERIIERISKYISNIKTATVNKSIISPKDLSGMNRNLVNGDPYAGSCEMDQYLLWRPLSGLKNHNTIIKNIYHIGASTHPGPGLGGVSGFHVSQTLKRK